MACCFLKPLLLKEGWLWEEQSSAGQAWARCAQTGKLSESRFEVLS